MSLSAVRPVTDGYYFVSVVSNIGDSGAGRARACGSPSTTSRPATSPRWGSPCWRGATSMRAMQGTRRRSRSSASRWRAISPATRSASTSCFAGSPLRSRGGGEGHVVCERQGRAARGRLSPDLSGRAERHLVHADVRDPLRAAPSGDIVRSALDAVSRTDAGLSVFKLKTLQVQTEESLSRERLLAMITGLRRRVRAAADVHRPVRVDELRRHATDAGDGLAHGARRASVGRAVARGSGGRRNRARRHRRRADAAPLRRSGWCGVSCSAWSPTIP